MCGAFRTKLRHTGGSKTHVRSAVSNNDAPDSNDALGRAVSRAEEVAAPRALMAMLSCGGQMPAAHHLQRQQDPTALQRRQPGAKSPRGCVPRAPGRATAR